MKPVSVSVVSLPRFLTAVLVIAILSLFTVNDSLSGCQRLKQSCWAGNKCCTGLSCQPGVHKCFNYPRKEGQPCVAGHPCGDGLSCEAGSHVCRKYGKTGDPCHATRPCARGYTCQPGVHRCYPRHRKEGQPCVAGFPCEKGLHCEAGAHVCRKPGVTGDPCHATRPCDKGYSCQPGVHKCFPNPRNAEGQPCVAGHPCKKGMQCEAGSQVCRLYGKFGDPCHATRQCGEGLQCQPFTHVCISKPLDINSGAKCDSFRFDDMSTSAKNAGSVMAYSYGIARSAGIARSTEQGTVYGPNGQFGCFATVCVGGTSDFSVGAFATLGLYNRWKDVAGKSIVTTQGASFPVVEIGGFTTAQVLNTSGGLIGGTNSISVGAGILPVQVGVMYCHTEVISGSTPVKKLMGYESRGKKILSSSSSKRQRKNVIRRYKIRYPVFVQLKRAKINHRRYYRLTLRKSGNGYSLDVVNDKNKKLKIARTGRYTGQFWKLTPAQNGYYELSTYWLKRRMLLCVSKERSDLKPYMCHPHRYSPRASWMLAKTKLPNYFRLVSRYHGKYKKLKMVLGVKKIKGKRIVTLVPVNGSSTHKASQQWKLTRIRVK